MRRGSDTESGGEGNCISPQLALSGPRRGRRRSMDDKGLGAGEGGSEEVKGAAGTHPVPVPTGHSSTSPPTGSIALTRELPGKPKIALRAAATASPPHPRSDTGKDFAGSRGFDKVPMLVTMPAPHSAFAGHNPPLSRQPDALLSPDQLIALSIAAVPGGRCCAVVFRLFAPTASYKPTLPPYKPA